MQSSDPQYTMSTVKYGSSDNQEGDLFLPNKQRPPVVCLLHGGFWRMPHGRNQMTRIAQDLAARGFAVWNIEYRRIGAPGGGLPGTFQDAADGIDHLAVLVAERVELDLNHVIIVGHSAGAHLALLSAARKRQYGNTNPVSRVHATAVVALAPVADLTSAYVLNVGNNAVGELLGGSPDQKPERYAAVSPIMLLPLGVRQFIVHGTVDEFLPIELTRGYVQAAKAAGDNVEFIEVDGAGHMDYLNPSSEAYAAFSRWIVQYLEAL
jgi:acetyl esterase/lipase